MRDPFYGPKRRLLRGQHHANDLERQINAWTKTVTHTHFTEIDADGATRIFKVKLGSDIPEELADIAADAAIALRSALDQTGYATAGLAGKLDPKHSYFPFASDEASMGTSVKGRCKDLPKEITSLFVGFQPYKGGNSALWAINELANCNKHRMLSPNLITVGGMELRLRPRIPNVQVQMPPLWDRAKNEMVVLRAPMDAKFEYNGKITVFISIDEIDTLHGEPIVGFLNAAASEVERVIMATEAECRRIGLLPATS